MKQVLPVIAAGRQVSGVSTGFGRGSAPPVEVPLFTGTGNYVVA